jgi:hypothetical protein
MKKIVAMIALLAIFITIYFVGGQLIAIYGIKSGIEQQDAEKISAHIDYSALHSNLKEQFTTFFMKQTTSNLKENPFAAQRMAFTSKIIDSIVDESLTPIGLARLMEGKKPQYPQDIERPQKSNSQKPAPFKNVRYTFDSLSKLSVWVRIDKEEEETRFIFSRNGLSWKLSNILLPTNMFDGSRSVSANNQLTGKTTISVPKP